MTQPPTRRRPGIPIWVWILALILVIVALWWFLAVKGASETSEPLDTTAAPAIDEPATGVGYGVDQSIGTGTGFGVGMGTELGTEPIDIPPPPAP